MEILLNKVCVNLFFVQYIFKPMDYHMMTLYTVMYKGIINFKNIFFIIRHPLFKDITIFHFMVLVYPRHAYLFLEPIPKYDPHSLFSVLG